ncbi:MAG: LPS-assembly protein LptD [Hyphomicrobiales bacterium]
MIPAAKPTLTVTFARTSLGKWILASTAGALLVVGISLPALSISVAQAQSVPGLVQPNADAQMFLEADELLYNDAANTVTAIGSVTIFYDGYTVEADEVVYDRGQSRVSARGNVVLIEPSGSVLRASSADLSDTLVDGFISALSLETPDRSFFTARNATRRDGSVTEFEEGTYTACQACEDNPDGPLAWQFHADRITYDENARMVYYDNVRLDFFGVPVIWLPFFAHADPTVERQTGFLQPGFVQNSRLGFSVSTPYYFALAPNYDLTITPTVHTSQGLQMEAEWRHRLRNGQYSFRASGIRQFGRDEFAGQPGDVYLRGSVATNGAFQLNSRWNAGWNLYLQSDRRYFRDYGLEAGSASEVTSDIYLTGLHDRSYFDARVQRIEVTTIDATGTLDSQDQPWTLPVVDYDRHFTPAGIGGDLQLAANITGLSREDSYIDSLTINGATTSSYEGFNGQQGRASLDLSWRRQFIGPMGQVFTPQVGFRGDVIGYNLGQSANGVIPDSEGAIFRAMPSVGMEWRWPILATIPGSSHVFEPTAQIIARPDASNGSEVPIEDSQSLVFDASNLFDWDKYSGYDQVEGGVRANVGLRYTGTFDNGLTLSALIGQSFHLAGENPYATANTLTYNEADSGLETDRSDYVASLTARIADRLALTASGRFDEDDFSLERGELIAAASQGRFSGSATYAYLAAQPNRGINEEEHQVTGTAAVQVNDGWRIAGNLRYDLEQSRVLSYGAGIAYMCDCFGIGLNYTHTAAASNDGIADNRVMLNVSLRTIGGVQTEVLNNEQFTNVFGTP